MKISAARKRFGRKAVDRSLYGKRDYASKNPLLSPIIESNLNLLSCTSPQLHTVLNPDISASMSTIVPIESVTQSDATSNLLAAAAMWRSRFLQRPGGSQSDESRAEDLVGVESKADSGQTSRGRRRRSGFHRRSVNARQKAWNVPSDLEPAASGREEPAECVTKHQSDSGGDQEEQEHQDRRTENELEEPPQSRHLKPHGEEPAGPESSTESAELGPLLQPWQQSDFSIEDVLRTAGAARGPVRRSLRNRRSQDVQAAGLAWVDHTSPQNSATQRKRRRTQGRLSGVLNPPLPVH